MNIKHGSFEGTGAALDVSLGFDPVCVILINSEDGDMVGFYIKGMSGSVDIDAAAGPLTDAGGIAAYAGDGSNARGFSVDAGNSESGKTYHYVAFGDQ